MGENDMLIFYVCMGILFVLIGFLYIKLNIEVRIIYDGDSRFIIKIIFIKQIKEYIWNNPDLSIFNLLAVLNRESNKVNPNRKGSLEGLINNLNLLPNYFRIFNLILRYMIVKKLDWKTSLGLDNAMNTAISTGCIWAFKGTIISILSSRSKIKDLILDVQPDFSNISFASRVECIFKLRLVHIIIIVIYILGLMIKKGFKLMTNRSTKNGGILKWIHNKKSSNILLKD